MALVLCSFRGARIFSPEAFNASGRVDQLLLASEEGVAGRADFYANISLVGGTRLETAAARTVYSYQFVSRVNIRFHNFSQVYSRLECNTTLQRVLSFRVLGRG